MSTIALIMIIILILIVGMLPNKYDFFENVQPLLGEDVSKKFVVNAPVIFENQIYPYSPYGRDTGKSCKDGCGALGICVNDICQLKNYTKTAFDVTI
jgi:hypothetical protein